MARAAARAQARGASRLADPTPSDGDAGPGLGSGWRPVPGGTAAPRLLPGRRIKLWRRRVTPVAGSSPPGRCEATWDWRGARVSVPGGPGAQPRWSRSSAPSSGPASRAPVSATPALLRLLQPRSASRAAGATAHGHWLLLEGVESVCGGRGSWVGSPCDPAGAGGIPATRSSLLFPSPPQLCGSPPCVSAGASGTATHSAQGFSVPKATQSATGISVHPGETLIPQVYSPLDSPVYPDSDSVALLCSSRVSGDFTQQHKASSVFKVVGYSACPVTNSQLLRAKCFLPSQRKETGWGFGSQSQDWSQALLSCGLTLRLHPTPGEIILNLPPVPTILFPRVQEEHPEFPST